MTWCFGLFLLIAHFGTHSAAAASVRRTAPPVLTTIQSLLGARELRLRTLEVENLRVLVQSNPTLSGAERTSLLAEVPMPGTGATHLGSDFLSKLDFLDRRGRALAPLRAALTRMRNENLDLLDHVVATILAIPLAKNQALREIDADAVPFVLLGRVSAPVVGMPWQNVIRDELDGVPRGMAPYGERAKEYAVHADPLLFVTKLHAQVDGLFRPSGEVAAN